MSGDEKRPPSSSQRICPGRSPLRPGVTRLGVDIAKGSRIKDGGVQEWRYSGAVALLESGALGSAYVGGDDGRHDWGRQL